MKDLHVIVDMQFGSCGKGLFAGYLALREKPDTLITAWAPNAGHTFVDADGTKYVNIALPNGIIEPSVKRILLGPGSVINYQILSGEMEQYRSLLAGKEILIHEHAAVVTERHRELEAAYGFGIGSTMKGVGEAVIQKIRRDRADMNIAGVALRGTPLSGLIATREEYNQAMDVAGRCVIEGAQGYSLGINSGYYPYTTSRECTKWQLFVDCGLPGNLGTIPVVHGVCRTFPIRVSNRYDKDGNQIGWSGPNYPDQKELHWERDLGIAPELTTVTRLPRRVFSFSAMQVQQAIRANGIHDVFLNFANYLKGARGSAQVHGERYTTLVDLIDMIQLQGAEVKWVGFGPKLTDIQETR